MKSKGIETKYSWKEVWEMRKDGLSVIERVFMDFPTQLMAFIFANFTNFLPNQITIISVFLEVFSGVVALLGNLQLAAGLFFFGIVFDGVDGQIARLKKQTSKVGEYIERRCYFESLNLLGFAAYFYFTFNDVSLFVLVALKYWVLLLKEGLMQGYFIFFKNKENKKQKKFTPRIWFGKKITIFSFAGAIIPFIFISVFNEFYALIYFKIVLSVSIAFYLFLIARFLKNAEFIEKIQ